MRCPRIAGLVLFASLLSGCLGEQVTFERLSGADRVEVIANNAGHVRTIRDRATITAVYGLVSRHDSGWSSPWWRTPVPFVEVNFYRKSHFIGGFGLGQDFLTTEVGQRFMTRFIPAEEVVEITGLLGSR